MSSKEELLGIDFFTTRPTVCPYLPNRMESKIVTKLQGDKANLLHNILSLSGFRRSMNMSYIPDCAECNSCVPIRIRVNDFKKSKSQRRVWNKNKDIYGTLRPAIATNEQYDLFFPYQDVRHNDSEMADMTFQDYQEMVDATPVDTCVFEFRDYYQNELKACILTDILFDGISAVYSFFDTTMSERSFGTYMILWIIEEALKNSIPYVYLGYWVPKSPKMDYKKFFSASEMFVDGMWVDFNPNYNP
jgi:arginine-tRNA-protein transferase